MGTAFLIGDGYALTAYHVVFASKTLSAQTLDKFPFRLNWTLDGEHAPFFVAVDKGFYKDAGLDVEILEGSGSTTVAQLTANGTSPVSYVDAATMMRGINAGMPIRSVGVTLQQSPMAFIYRADAPRPTKISEIKGSRIAITAGDADVVPASLYQPRSSASSHNGPGPMLYPHDLFTLLLTTSFSAHAFVSTVVSGSNSGLDRSGTDLVSIFNCISYYVKVGSGRVKRGNVRRGRRKR